LKITMTTKVLISIGFLIFLSTILFAESIKLSTYYPAPFGAYDRLKLVPRDSLPLDPNCDDKLDLGTLYYDNGLKERTDGIYLCQKTSKTDFDWILLNRQVEVNNESIRNEKVVCFKSNGKFGVCTNNISADGTCGCI